MIRSRDRSRARSLLQAAAALLLGCAGAVGCGSEVDVSHIDNATQFMAACQQCPRCEDSDPSLLWCVNEDEVCEPLCPGRDSASWKDGDTWICRCMGTNDFWVFDARTQQVSLRDEPPPSAP